MIIICLTHPEEVFVANRRKKHLSILTFLNTTRMQVIHFISKAILCFLTPGFDANKLSFCFGVHDVIRYLELSHQPEQR